MRAVAESHAKTQRATIALADLSSDGSAAQAAELALRGLPGVRYAYVCAAMEMAYVVYDAGQVCVNQLVAAVAQAGLSAGAPELR